MLAATTFRLKHSLPLPVHAWRRMDAPLPRDLSQQKLRFQVTILRAC